MASEIRVDTSKNASGLCTVTYSNTGAVLSGITTGTFSGDITGTVTGTSSGNPTLANGSNNRVITATGANALNGESSLTFDGTTLMNAGGTITAERGAIPSVEAKNSTTSSYARFYCSQTSGSGGYAAFQKLGTTSTAIGGANATQVWCTGDAPLVIGVNGGEKLRITGIGSVGINVTTPEELLDLGESNQQNLKLGQRGYLGQAYSTTATILGHSVKADTVNTVASQMMVTETNSGGGAPSAIRQVSGTIQFHTASSGTANAVFDSEKVRIDSNGSILVGNTAATFSSPTPSLNIEKSSTTTGPLIFLYNGQSAETGATCEIRVGQNYREANRIVFGRENNNNWQSSAAGTASYMGFYTNSAGTIAEKMRITSGGNIGVNCDSPTSISNSRGITLQASGGTAAGFINFMDSADNSDARVLADDGSLYIHADASDNTADSLITFNVDSSEKARINYNGNFTVQRYTCASENTSGDFKITVSGLTNNGGNNWRKCGVFVIYNGINPDATNSRSAVGYYGVGSVTTWNWLGEDEEFTADPLSCTLDDAQTTSFRLNFNVADNNTGSVTVFVNAWNVRPIVSIAG